MSGPRDGETLRFNIPSDVKETTLSFGRRDTCDVCLDYDSQVSRVHAHLIYETGQFWIEDLNSRNGTFVNNERLTEKIEIKPGQLFRVGRTWLRLDASSSDETQTAKPIIDDDDLDLF